jgi:hypothetical protein
LGAGNAAVKPGDIRAKPAPSSRKIIGLSATARPILGVLPGGWPREERGVWSPLCAHRVPASEPAAELCGRDHPRQTLVGAGADAFGPACSGVVARGVVACGVVTRGVRAVAGITGAGASPGPTLAIPAPWCDACG